MEKVLPSQPPVVSDPNPLEAWARVSGVLEREMSKATYDTWIRPLKVVGCQAGTFTLRAFNTYGRDWIDSNERARIVQLLGGIYPDPVELQIEVEGVPAKVLPKPTRPAALPPPTAQDAEDEKPVRLPPDSPRKAVLQRAYGSERAAVIQPERGLFVTFYFLNEWLPRLGHSAVAVILAARTLCYWNPMTGEKRNTIETEMGELARKAAVSVRTVKDVLKNPLVRQYFLRYRVRRVMTSNGVRTAGIILQVRMDDPLTPEDQARLEWVESETWYSPEFEDEGEEE